MDSHYVDKLARHEAHIFMITCMDFRFVHDVKSAMHKLGF